MAKMFLLAATLSGFLAVCFGAFAAHGLRGKIEPHLLSAFTTGVQYHFYHTLALLLLGLWMLNGRPSGEEPSRALNWSGYAFIFGIILFSGSLYAMALGGPSWLGPLTPVGGVSFLVGWILLFWAAGRVER